MSVGLSLTARSFRKSVVVVGRGSFNRGVCAYSNEYGISKDDYSLVFTQSLMIFVWFLLKAFLTKT